MDTQPALALRLATSSDSLGVARVHIATWRAAYRGIIPDSYLDGLDEETRASRYTFDRKDPDGPLTWIALERDEIVGFASLGPSRDDPTRGEIYALYVSPGRWRAGVGTVLMARAEENLAASGFAEASLWVLRDNARGRRFYEATGWRDDDVELRAEFDGYEVVEARYSKSLRQRSPNGR